MKRRNGVDTSKLKKSRGRRKSKAERLARSTPVSYSPDDLLKLLQGTSSREWDAAQSLALQIGTPEARANVVRVILQEREAPRAAAHYAKRLNMREEELLSAVSSNSMISPLLLARFLVELDENSLVTTERLHRFVWPWLLETVEKKGDKTALKAAVHLMLTPTASADAKAQDKKERGQRLERALVKQCLQSGKLLHLVPTHARAFADRITVVYKEEKENSDTSEMMEKKLLCRQQVARRIQNLLQLMWPDARVLVFGSSITGMLPDPGEGEVNQADVDLCALLPSATQFRQETASLVTEITEHLSLYLLPNSTKETEHVTAVTGARIPIVHFRDPHTKLPCDLCVNNIPALWNTRLLRWLLHGGVGVTPVEHQQLYHVRRLCKWLREWRRVKNRVVGGALSSYGLMLLALYYLQRVGILPVLDCHIHVNEDEATLRDLSEDGIDKILETTDKAFIKVRTQTADGMQEWQALRCGFFRFYTCEFDYENTVVSLRTKEIMSKSSKGWSRQNDSRLCLEDPVETERDLGMLCSKRAFGRLRCAFAHASIVLSCKEDKQQDKVTCEDVESDLMSSWAYEHDIFREVDEIVQAAEDRYLTQCSIAQTDTMTVPKENGVSSRSGSGNLREARDAERRVKLQHFLVLRAFNLRRSKETLHQQFQFLKKRVESTDSSTSGDFLVLDELCAYLSIPPYRRMLLVQVFGLSPQQTHLGFDDFLRFLQSAAVQAAREERKQHEDSLPVPPPRSSSHLIKEALVVFDPSRAQCTVARAPPAPGLWKKREVTIQERITEYTKIDEKGQPQRLVEKERHQTEVLHMESLDGEFAHREITQFEQTEHLNDEMVHLDHGREEFLHLKSLHDEISRFESSVPPGGPTGGSRPEECEQQPPSPYLKRASSAPGPACEDTGSENDQARVEAETMTYVELDCRKRSQQQLPEEDGQQET
ncbi:Catalytic subunit of TRAMP (Trf4-Pap2p-Mtr4p-Air1p-2p) [Phytophthora palmivora]|uniref:Catalytic subunit of TRAMP (Trf4-Pap2p-Mtr4p-Air1p-2p) n=1 Tax=Phytophthora palmivora TaxID=4796 RepID=A0A2P4XBU2_9STRA|nr:Catalytic subunit of TRAMP (Trf4-Pap2p-Mtr4p-Air1p-2p) [Phytophthora palmivora]